MSETKEKKYKINLGVSSLIVAPDKLIGNEENENEIAAYITTGNDD